MLKNISKSSYISVIHFKGYNILFHQNSSIIFKLLIVPFTLSLPSYEI